MDVGLHQCAQRCIDHAMALDGLLTGELVRANSHLKMASAVASPGVSGVTVAVVDDVELIRLERRFESASNQRYAVGGHGRTWTTGLISTSPKTPSST